MIVLSPQRERTRTPLPGIAVFWLVPLVALVLDPPYSRHQSNTLLCPRALGKLPKYTGSSSLLSPGKGDAQNFPQSMCVPAGLLLPV